MASVGYCFRSSGMSAIGVMWSVVTWKHLMGLLLCVRECAVMSEIVRGPPGCLFPDFLQSTPPGKGDWTWKYDKATHVGKVHGGIYTICSNYYSKGNIGIEESCQESYQRRKCIKEYGPNLFAVQHEEPRPTYQCIRFIIRSPTVIQLEVSDRWRTADGICNQNMTLDHSPWISVNHYKTAITSCPFSGGYNFHQISQFSFRHEERRLCRQTTYANKPPPVRVESDCVENEGMNMHFRDSTCIPNDSFFGISQKLVCMASWEVDGDGFAFLRKENDRAFYCVRIVYDNKKPRQVVRIVIFLDWECYRESDFRGAQQLSYLTHYVVFTASEKRVIAIPCSGDEVKCSEDCDQEAKCLRTCHQCLNTTGERCLFDEEVIGSWTIRNPHHSHTRLLIHENYLNHSSLGKLDCVTFNPDFRVALRSVLWGTYMNGCYPRFMCMYYDSPALSVLRYRMSNIQQWPVELSDEQICHEDKFLIPPDFNDPKDRYQERPWDIALQSSQTIYRMPCIYPNELPDMSSFVDDKNNSGCITLRSKSSPKTITLVYVQRSSNPYTGEETYLMQHQEHQYECIAAMTYISSYKTVMTLTQDHEHEALCWMVVNSSTLVVVKTSSCNKQTAQGIMRRDDKYLPHLKWQLHLGSAGKEIDDICQGISKDNEKERLARLEELEEEDDITDNNSATSFHLFILELQSVLFLCILLCLLH